MIAFSFRGLIHLLRRENLRRYSGLRKAVRYFWIIRKYVLDIRSKAAIWIFKNYQLACCKNPYKLKSMECYEYSELEKRTVILPRQQFELKPPKFNLDTRCCSPQINYEDLKLSLPEVLVESLCEVVVIGATNVLEKNGSLYFPESLHPERDVFWPETFDRMDVDIVSREARLYLPKRVSERIPIALNLVGQCSGNYAHFITEVLAKLVVADHVEIPAKIPILIDGWFDRKLLDILRDFNINRREIIRVDMWQKIQIENLINIANLAYVPAESRSFYTYGKTETPTGNQFLFSPNVIGILRQKAELIFPKSSSCGRKRIFVRRNSESFNKRFLINQDEIESIATEYGFYSIEPTSLNFADQVKVFQSAEFVVAPIGASLVNLIFADKTTKNLVLSPCYDNANYHYFLNLLSAFGQSLNYVLGPQVQNQTKSPLNADYYICPSLFRRSLEESLSD